MIHRHAEASPCGFVSFGSFHVTSKIMDTTSTTIIKTNVLIITKDSSHVVFIVSAQLSLPSAPLRPVAMVRRDGRRFLYRLGPPQGGAAPTVLNQLLIVPDKNGDVCCAY